MKNVTLTLVILILFISEIIGQTNFAIKLGVNQSNSNYINLPSQNSVFLSTQPRIGYFFGGSLNQELNSRFDYINETQVSVEGFKFKKDRETEFKYTYIRYIPQLGIDIYKTLSAHVGPNIGYKINEFSKEGSNDFIKSLDAGLFGGVSFKIKKMSVSIDYYQGLTNSTNLDFRDVNGNLLIGRDEVKQFNKLWQLGFGYSIANL